ncbi:CASTOR/POLLUX-related putative ion channel [Engelhardtia mirabilis]|uniref:CASTOR/POLLUX/SYM8 ion channel conserved domain-containing protein n=1 Tax=Engelhardtia mirabilis TaxID=2528011 RepID=A0A518BEN1_9BACT|nr:hypothetical protein Pla133_04080 [Planctomycetes bacterium Pla133]QDU99669.1 hypothetical protein Pla86_04080 [Planctomycetes bacterium Pla86]
MTANLLRRSRFLLERWIQRGILHQLMVMICLVVAVAGLGGTVAWLTTPQFEGPGDAIWWAFLRLTDPGYLGDDEGLTLRVISTTVTVLGYVLFMGSLIAIMTQWLSTTMRQLESGLTPISMRDHMVVLGWSNRTPEIVLQLLNAQGRLKRFLESADASRLRIVIQVEEVDAVLRQELRDHLGEHWNRSQIFMRSGSPLQPDHLERLDLRRASVILVPGADFDSGGSDGSDTRVVKTLLTMSGLLRDVPADDRPSVVAEIFDPFKANLARNAFEGDVEVISSDRTISRLLSQSVRHRSLAQVLFGLLAHRRGNSIYLRSFPQLAGQRPSDLLESFPTAVVLGLVRGEGAERRAHLDPPGTEELRRDDLLLLLAPSYDAGAPRVVASTQPRTEVRTHAPRPSSTRRTHRILVLGWSHKLGALAEELGQSSARDFEVTVMSRVPVEERERWLARVAFDSERVRIVQLDGDYALESDLLEVDLDSFDNITMIASDWMDSSEDADARTILGYVLLRSHLDHMEDPPEVLVELLDPDNVHLFHRQHDEYLVTPQVLSYLIAHVALRPELHCAYDALLCAGGTEINLQSAAEFGLVGERVDFALVQRRAREAGMTALGLLIGDGAPQLNPDRSRTWELAAEDQLILLSTDQATR